MDKRADSPDNAVRQAKRPVELCSLCGNNMRLPDEDKIKYDYDLPPKHSGVCSQCAE